MFEYALGAVNQFLGDILGFIDEITCVISEF